MLYYLSTETLQRENNLYLQHLEKLKNGISEYIFTGLPEEIRDIESVHHRLEDLATELITEIMGRDREIHAAFLMCGMNRHGIRWSTYFAVPQGKKLMIIDEDGDTYSFDEFDELAGETCELSMEDEKILAEIRAAETQPDEGLWKPYLPYVDKKDSQ